MNDAAPYVLHGAPGSGAVPVHAALTLIGAPVRVIDVSPWESEDERERLRDVNPMRQVPVLRLPDGQTMTESAAMLIWLADRHPEARLAPAPDAPLRAQFLRWMCFIPASIYSMFWVRDVPTRLVAGGAGALPAGAVPAAPGVAALFMSETLKMNFPSNCSRLTADCVIVTAWPAFRMVESPPGTRDRYLPPRRPSDVISALLSFGTSSPFATVNSTSAM